MQESCPAGGLQDPGRWAKPTEHGEPKAICGGATAQPPQTGALRGEHFQSRTGGPRGRSAAAHRHHTKVADTQTSREVKDTPASSTRVGDATNVTPARVTGRS